jgi:hypothetical protein
MGFIQALFLFAPLVLVPLAVYAVDSGLARCLRALWLAGALVALSFACSAVQEGRRGR